METTKLKDSQLDRTISGTLCLAAGLLQLVWFFLPQFEYIWLTEDELVILSYSSFGSKIEMGSAVSWAYLLSFFAALIAVLVYGRRARHFFLAFVVLALFGLVPFGGMVIETGASATLRDLINLIMGAIAAILYVAHARRE